MIRTLFMFSAAFALVAATRTAVEQCTNLEGNLPTKTYIDGCTTPPCQITDEDMVVNLKFRTPHRIESMQTRATLYIDRGVASIPLTLNLGQNAETCDYLTKRSCPVKRNKTVKATFAVPINTIFLPAGMTYALEVQVIDEERAAVTCFRTMVTRSA